MVFLLDVDDVFLISDTLINLSVTGNISSGGNISGTNLIGRLQTASQPNITTIGTLSSLLVTGTASCNFLSASFITGSIQTESQPNITSVGTLVNLKTSGFIGINNSNPVKPIDIISGNGFGSMKSRFSPSRSFQTA